MILYAILIGLVAMVCYGLANTFAQPPAKRLGPAQFLFVRGLATVAILAVVCIPTYARSHDPLQMLYAFAIGVFGYLPPLLFTHGLKVSRIGIVAPIASTAPLITILLSYWLLHSPLHAVQWLAAVIIVLANVVVAINFRDFRQSNIAKLSSGVPHGLGTSVLWGVVFYLIIFPGRVIGPWQTALFLELGVTAAAAAHLMFRHEKLRWRESVKLPLLLNAFLIAGGTVLYNVGVRWFNIGVIASMTNSNAVVSVIAAVIFFRETFTRREKLTAAAMVLGILLISL